MGKVRKTLQSRVKRSHVWTYFKSERCAQSNSAANKCLQKDCSFRTPNKNDGCTNTMRQHLENKHSIYGPKKADVDKALKTIEKSIDLPWYVKTAGEWLALLLIEDGFSFHAIAHSRFVAAAFHYMKLKSYFCHKSIKTKAFEQVAMWKEKVKSDIKSDLAAGVRYGLVVDEWSSISTRRYMNVCLSSSRETTIGLGLIRCFGSITAQKTVDLFKGRIAEYGLDARQLVGLSSDGAAVMTAAGNILDHLCTGEQDDAEADGGPGSGEKTKSIPHQLCLGKRERERERERELFVWLPDIGQLSDSGHLPDHFC